MGVGRQKQQNATCYDPYILLSPCHKIYYNRKKSRPTDTYLYHLIRKLHVSYDTRWVALDSRGVHISAHLVTASRVPSRVDCDMIEDN